MQRDGTMLTRNLVGTQVVSTSNQFLRSILELSKNSESAVKLRVIQALAPAVARQVPAATVGEGAVSSYLKDKDIQVRLAAVRACQGAVHLLLFTSLAISLRVH